jgi:hypothetical protein
VSGTDNGVRSVSQGEDHTFGRESESPLPIDLDILLRNIPFEYSGTYKLNGGVTSEEDPIRRLQVAEYGIDTLGEPYHNPRYDMQEPVFARVRYLLTTRNVVRRTGAGRRRPNGAAMRHTGSAQPWGTSPGSGILT